MTKKSIHRIKNTMASLFKMNEKKNKRKKQKELTNKKRQWNI